MLLLTGLGNPGSQYARHRHNIGFMAINKIAGHFEFGPERKKFHSILREGTIETDKGRVKTLLLKPETFMNESGRAVMAATTFYKLKPEQIFVFHDELDLAPGKVRMKQGGGHAGHNGLRSIDAHLGKNYHRIRLGIGHPGDKARVHSHVLGNFSTLEQEWLDPLLDAIARSLPLLLSGNQDAANRFQTEIARYTQPQHQNRERTGPEASNSPPSNASNIGSMGNDTNKKNPFQEALSNLFDKKE